MTSEVAVLNRLAVALAADSAVTVSDAAGPKKRYSSAEKIFELSWTEPIAVMVYNAATYLDVPWEVILKMFRDEVKEHASIEECHRALTRFIGIGRRFVPEDRERQWVTDVVRAEFTRLMQEHRRHVSHRLEQDPKKGLDAAALQGLLTELLLERQSEVTAAPALFDLLSPVKGEFAETYAPVVRPVAEEVFAGIGTDAVVAGAIAMVAELLLRRNRVGAESGLVVAGYGDKDLFPSLRQIEVDGMILGRARAWTVRSHDVAASGGVILPFAYSKAVRSFLEGVHPKYEQAFHTVLREVVLGTLGDLTKGQLGFADRSPLRGFANVPVRTSPSRSTASRRGSPPISAAVSRAGEPI